MSNPQSFNEKKTEKLHVTMTRPHMRRLRVLAGLAGLTVTQYVTERCIQADLSSLDLDLDEINAGIYKPKRPTTTID